MHPCHLAIMATVIAAVAAAPQGQASVQGTATTQGNASQVVDPEQFLPAVTPAMGIPATDDHCWQATNNVLEQVYPNWARLAAANDTSTRIPNAKLSVDADIDSDSSSWVVNWSGGCIAQFMLLAEVPVTAKRISDP